MRCLDDGAILGCLLVRIDQWCNHFSRRPGGGLVITISELVEAVLVDRVNLVNIAVAKILLEVDDERADHVWKVVARKVRWVLLRVLVNIKLGRAFEAKVGQVVDLDAILDFVKTETDSACLGKPREIAGTYAWCTTSRKGEGSVMVEEGIWGSVYGQEW